MTKLSKISIAMFVITFLGQIVVCNLMSVKTKELNQISDKISQLQNDISIISQEIYLDSSIVSLEEKARSQGFLVTQTPVKAVANPVVARVF